MIADLHTHSNASDGILRPEELVSRAKSQGVSLLALTDHDTTAGIDAAKREAIAAGMGFIAGVEISTLWNGIGIHIVGLNIDTAEPTLANALSSQQNIRDERAKEIAARLAKLGVSGSYEGAKQIAGNAEIGRPHFAQHLLNEGVVTSIEQAFKKYLGAGKPGDVKQLWPDVREATAWIRAAGGKAVIAHPDKYKMTRTKLRALIEDFKNHGGQAIEVISGLQTPNITRDMTGLCERFALEASCGSDFHQPNAHWQELGSFGKLAPHLTPVWHDWPNVA